MVDRLEHFEEQEIRFLDETIKIQGRALRKTLPVGFQPDNWSVICGRGKEVFSHIGNKRLRILVDANLNKYSSTKSKMQKTLIVSSIVDAVRSASKIGGFVKQDPNTKIWEEVGDDVAREKVGQLLRESMTKKNPNKLQQRKEQRKAKVLKKKGMKREASSGSSASASSVSTTETSVITSASGRNLTSLSEVTNHSVVSSLENPADSIDFDPLPIEDANGTSFVFSFEDFQF